ncbi:MAG: transcription factor [Methanosarcinaceae archaeon]
MIDLNDQVVRGYLTRLVGEDGLIMIEKMPKGEVTDEQIAETSEVLLNVVRRTLFTLSESKLAICKRERDSSSGWLTYLWHLDMADIEPQLAKEKKKLTRNLKIRLEFEENNVFYVCPDGCVRMFFNDAAESEFLCQVCGEDLVFQDNTDFTESLKKRLEAII